MAKAKKSIPSVGKPGRSAAKKAVSKITTSKTMIRYLPELCEELETAAAGLLNTSESDFPYKFFSLSQHDTRGDTGVVKLTGLGFLVAIGISEELIDQYKLPVDQLIEERTLDGFFPSIEDIAGFYGTDTNDPKVIAESKRFRKLEALLKKRLHEVKVFRVGQVEIRCYIAGFAKHGNIAGLVTTAIET
ncbi:MAG: nuclease A inhibitor family protein [Ginsengibacter sp.]